MTFWKLEPIPHECREGLFCVLHQEWMRLHKTEGVRCKHCHTVFYTMLPYSTVTWESDSMGMHIRKELTEQEALWLHLAEDFDILDITERHLEWRKGDKSSWPKVISDSMTSCRK